VPSPEPDPGVVAVSQLVTHQLVARSLSFDRGPTAVLRGVSLTVAGDDRVGIIGPNGVGKTTLLRILAGELDPSAGRVERIPSSLAVGYLRQERPLGGAGVAEVLARRTGVTGAEEALHAATAALARGAPGSADAYARALDRWTVLGVADFDARVDAVLDHVGLGASRRDQPVATLSGGEAARVDLAALMLHQAPILLLDEPTNDLDLDGLALLEESVLRTDRGLVIVSHDRALLERVVTTVVELDEHTRSATTYHGGWAAYERERRGARARAEAAHQTYIAERDRLRSQARRERQWSAAGVRRAATRPRDNDKSIRSGRIEAAENRAGQATRALARLNRLETVDKPWEGWELRLRLADAQRSGTLAAELRGAVVERGGFILGPVDVDLRHGDRVRIVGPNGAGKTTLLHALLGRLALVSGTQRTGPAVVVGELGQARRDLDGGDVLDAVTRASGATPEQVRSSLAKLGLDADDVTRPPASLSPGERTRAVLAVFQLLGVNLLVLDEPTNHLDLPAIEQLEQVLGTYDGTLLLVSHDRRFVENVSCTRTWHVGGGQVTEARI
jgi:ATPase subunit of ABC transporter with duplicated ATPase domains